MKTFGTLTNLITKEVHEIVTFNLVKVYNDKYHPLGDELNNVMYRSSKPNIRVQGPYLLHLDDYRVGETIDWVIKFNGEEYSYENPHSLNYKIEQIDNFEAMKLVSWYRAQNVK